MSAAFAAGAYAEINPSKGSGEYDWSSLDAFEDMDLSGQVVTVAGPWLTPENAIFEGIVSHFEEATGADVQYSGSDSFEQQIVIDLQAGSPPNLAIFPQPGLAADMASRDLLKPLSSDLKNKVMDAYAAGQSWVDLGTYENGSGNDDFYGVFFRVDLKSLVWYSPDNFADYGYEVPETMEELIALSEQMVADGETPWCIGLGSGAATGWPATDWVEDIMLRLHEPDVYDKWVSHEIPFNDPRVVEAIETFGQFAKNDDYVQGGAQAVASTDFRDSPKGLFSVPADCFMHRQASFIPAFFPEGTVIGEDADFFYFPAFESKDLGNPVLGAGTVVTMPKESEAARALMEYLTTPLAHEIWMANGGFLTPHTGVNNDLFANDTLRRQAEILQNADTFRFDGSDLMPGGIGAGAFWTGMVDFVSGDSAEEVAADIEQAWDNL
ncbi:alpha-glucoside ABC transporter substrate-binding protein [Saccharospirillum salsuginis]|uniref:Alpha-glucoside ABC transporter substrate-binding protein n=2 Tax=Saccharospirillum salsuginis TaxID=418750 RepID=A0A918KCC8_9GAMM|nr:alpha-glucoside ABC transporter substrate-binding protein [Saccharospirillum salsuginis]